MAVGLISLSVAGRQKLGLVAAALHMGAVFVCLTIVVYEVLSWVCTFCGVAFFMMQESVLVGQTPLLTAALVGMVALAHVWAAVFAFDQRFTDSRWHKVSTEVVGVCLIALVVSFGVLIVNGFYVLRFQESMTNGLQQGMIKYAASAEDKAHTDWLQQKFQCCGVNGFVDWVNGTTLVESFANRTTIDESSARCERPLLLLQNGSRVEGELRCYLPFSCCRQDRIDCTPEYQLRAPTTGLADVDDYALWMNRTAELFYDSGCVLAVHSHFPSWTALLMVGALCATECICLLLTQLVASSTRVAIKLNADNAQVSGWLCPFFGSSEEQIVDNMRESMEKSAGPSNVVQDAESMGGEKSVVPWGAVVSTVSGCDAANVLWTKE